MAEMRLIEVASPGGPEAMRLARGPVPEPREDELLIRVLAAGVNRPDVAQRSGSYPPPPGASPILGLEVAGEVVALGASAQRFRVGDRVTALANGGGYAEFCAVPETQALAWPAGYDAIRAAALPETFFTVWANLFGHGRLAAGESVLVHGGTSGIGVTALQLAREFGASAFATAGSDEKVAAIGRLGAVGINYRSADFVAVLRERTGGRGVDVVLDMVGAPYFTRNLQCLALGGRLVMIAFLGGNRLDGLNLAPIMTRRLVVTGSTMRPRTTAEKGEIATALAERVWPILAAGRAGPIIHQVFPLAAVADAHRLMESSAHIGKLVLDLTAG